MTRAFVIRPFSEKTDLDGKKINFDEVHNKLIQPAIKDCGLQGSTTGEIIDAGNIREDMFQLILEADLVICDITIHNANVFYELGIRHALRKKRTILIKGENVADSTPFDILTDRYLAYDVDNPAAALPQLVAMIDSTLRSDRETDSPIFKLLPSLPEADPAHVQVLPFDYREEVDRAKVAKSKGWLRLLSLEVRKLRFQWQGLKYVADAQWKLKDLEAARDSYELVRQTYPWDTDANLALANIYERLYRDEKTIDLLTKSEQALERVLASNNISSQARVEALALKGRNKKTRWRREFENLDDRKQRRDSAINRSLLNSFQAYFEAFSENLNHFYSGLTALQMGEIVLNLSQNEDLWKASFDDDDEAEAYKKQMEKNVESLKFAVKASILSGLRSLEESDPNRVWAEISKADFCFLNDSNPNRIIQQYKDAIPLDNPFAWDAARGQLELFVDLGINEDIARQVIDTIEQRLNSSKISEQSDEEKRQSDKEDRKLEAKHIIVFAGHMIDAPSRSEARFPENTKEQVRKLIKKQLEKLCKEDKYEYHAFASAAPGGDILFHEVCEELKIPSTICLPMPSDEYANKIFQENYLDKWRSRFLDMKDKHEILELSDRVGLPNWLKESGKNSWERGNEWVLQMVEALDVAKRTLLVFWDGEEQGEQKGGTAHMYQLAKETGRMHIERIDANLLTNNQENS